MERARFHPHQDRLQDLGTSVFSFFVPPLTLSYSRVHAFAALYMQRFIYLHRLQRLSRPPSSPSSPQAPVLQLPSLMIPQRQGAALRCCSSSPTLRVNDDRDGDRDGVSSSLRCYDESALSSWRGENRKDERSQLKVLERQGREESKSSQIYKVM